ncbi:MAG: hypothetical protein AAF655_06350 [Bacteroidota bacterium]
MAPFFLRISLFTLIASTLSCSSYKLSVERVSSLTPMLKEVSGLTIDNQQKVWGLNDSGNPASLYQIDFSGNLIDSMLIVGTENKDWEALTTDPEGNLYILDAGNNGHSRKDLKMYIWDQASRSVTAIPFSYKNQNAFPPAEKDKFFDLEAAFWAEDYIYLIGKNRFTTADSGARVYKLPIQEGSYSLNPIAEVDLGKFVATDAALSPGGTLAILTYRLAPLPNVPGLQSRLFLIENWQGEGSYIISASKKVPRKGLLRQYEAIEWISEEEILIGSEEIRGRGPVLLKVRLKKRK